MSFMQHALFISRRALGLSSPNPAVGAVLVKDGEIVGEGWTQPPGQAHAEIVAVRQAGNRAKGATLYVTLEPCSHFGRTPPCADAVVDAGIAEVHIATLDPNPVVNGNGLARLTEAGIKTHVCEGQEEAREVMEGYAKHIKTRMPFVIAKFAMSLDGKIATRTGDSKWISGTEARSYTHKLRSGADAIMVGINTVVADNPLLTARDDNGNPLSKQPLRVIVDSKGRIPIDSRILFQPGRTLVAVSNADSSAKDKIASTGAEVVSLPDEHGRVDLAALMNTLGERGMTSVFVEGGGTILGSLFDASLVDKTVAFVSPAIVGGSASPSPVGGVGVEKMAGALRLHRVKVMQFGVDVAITGYVEANSDVYWNS